MDPLWESCGAYTHPHTQTHLAHFWVNYINIHLFPGLKN